MLLNTSNTFVYPYNELWCLNMRFPNPVVAGINPKKAKYNTGDVLTITGEHFGTFDPAPSAVSSMTITLGTEVCTSPAWVSDTEITCTIGRGGGIDALDLSAPVLKDVHVIVERDNLRSQQTDTSLVANVEGCPVGHKVVQAPNGVDFTCKKCEPGTFSPGGPAPQCWMCPAQTYTFDGRACHPCPRSEGVLCKQGRLFTLDGYWAPAGFHATSGVKWAATFPADGDKVNEWTSVFQCLGRVPTPDSPFSPCRGMLAYEFDDKKTDCVPDNRLGLAPESACAFEPPPADRPDPATETVVGSFRCDEGHGGALCAVCQEGWYFQQTHCVACDASQSSESVVMTFVVGSLAAVALLFFYRLTKGRLPDMKRKLHQLRSKLHLDKRHHRRDKRHLKKLQRHHWKHGSGGEHLPSEHHYMFYVESLSIAVRREAVQGMHWFYVNVKNGTFGLGETVQILFNAAKVYTHLYGTLAYCIQWPTAIDQLFDIFSVLSLNLVENSRMPCWYPKFDYFDQFWAMALTPVVLLVVCVIYGTATAHFAEKKLGSRAKRTHGGLRRTQSTARGASMMDSVKQVVKKGLAAWLPPVKILRSTFPDLQIESSALHSHDLDFHSRVLLCRSMAGCFSSCTT